VLTHQPLHLTPRDLLAGTLQGLPHPPVAVGLVIGHVHLTDPRQDAFVADRAGGLLAAGALVVGGRRHAQDPADRLDTEALAMIIDERGHFVRSASSSVAKNTLAAFKISFARRSS
jgi:hypothetical protein